MDGVVSISPVTKGAGPQQLSLTTNAAARVSLMNGGADVGDGNPLPVSLSAGTVVVPGTVTVMSVASPIGTIISAGTTIANPGTFETALAPNAGRIGGMIQNTGTDDIRVFYGAAGTASVDASVLLQQGKALDFTAGVPGGVYRGEIAVTGTASSPYVTVEAT